MRVCSFWSELQVIHKAWWRERERERLPLTGQPFVPISKMAISFNKYFCFWNPLIWKIHNSQKGRNDLQMGELTQKKVYLICKSGFDFQIFLTKRFTMKPFIKCYWQNCMYSTYFNSNAIYVQTRFFTIYLFKMQI